MNEIFEDVDGILTNDHSKTYRDRLFEEVKHIFDELSSAYVEPGLQERILVILVIWLLINIFLIVLTWKFFGEHINNISLNEGLIGDNSKAENGNHLKQE